ncbi:MAG: hypothetical protein H7326_02645 [Bdellovibrionaceae bacterium]|nr:hypothetical protein [Pseudobdellovibrionaceae bacterium]
MRQLVSLFLSGALLAAVPAFAFEDFSAEQGNDEYSATFDQQSTEAYSFDESMTPLFDRPGDGRRGPPGRDDGRWGRGRPPGTHRQAEYRWDRSLRRWVHVGYICRPGRHLQNEATDITQ